VLERRMYVHSHKSNNMAGSTSAFERNTGAFERSTALRSIRGLCSHVDA
jgi:hypothetical protein